MSASGYTGTPGDAWASIPATVAGSVDVFDATARLESQGFGDAHAIRAGYHDAFDHAAHLLADQGHRVVVTPRPAAGLAPAIARALALLGGVALCVMTLANGDHPPAVFAAGAASWLGGQILGAVLWWGLGQGRLAAASATALRLAIAVVVCCAVVALAWAQPAIVAWAAWGVVGAVGTCLLAGWRFTGIVAAGAALSLTGLALPGTRFDGAVAYAVIAGATGWALLVLARRAGGAAPAWTPALTRSVGWTTLQVAALLGILALLFGRLGPAFIVIATAGLLASAAADPLHEFCARSARSVASVSTTWRIALWASGTVGVLAVWAVTGVGELTGWATAAVLGLPWTVPLATAAIAVSALTAAASILLRSGHAPTSALMCLAGMATLAAAVWLADGSTDAVRYGAWMAASLVLTTAVGASRHASPSAW